MKTLLFENRVCSRCMGSGEYSYCSMYGRTCFKCAGAGAVLTARGRVAQAFLNKARMAKASEFKVGDSYLYEGIPGFSRSEWVKITEIRPTANGNGELDFVGVNKKGETTGFNGLTAATELRKARTKEELAAMKAAALEFQASLTKAGTPRKRKAVKEAATS